MNEYCPFNQDIICHHCVMPSLENFHYAIQYIIMHMYSTYMLSRVGNKKSLNTRTNGWVCKKNLSMTSHFAQLVWSFRLATTTLMGARPLWPNKEVVGWSFGWNVQKMADSGHITHIVDLFLCYRGTQWGEEQSWEGLLWKGRRRRWAWIP